MRGDRLFVAYVMYRFDVGGLENGVVNLINRTPAVRFLLVVVTLTEVATDFRRRVERDDVQYVSLQKPPRQDVQLLPALFGLFGEMGGRCDGVGRAKPSAGRLQLGFPTARIRPLARTWQRPAEGAGF
jgi:hypothetical protein